MILRYPTLLISAALASAVLAQPTLTAGNSVPTAGQTFTIKTADDFISAGPTGAAVTYDYWNMLVPPTGTQDIKYLATSTTSTSTLIPSASLLSTDGGSDTLFWDVTSAGLEMVGSRSAFEGVLDFNDPSLELKLPCSLGDTWSDPTGDTYTVSGFPVTRVGTVTGVADAWGSLTMPGYMVVFPEVLRVHVRRYITDNSIVLSTIRISNIDYFYSGTLEYPVVKLVEDSTQISGGAWTITKRQSYIGNGFIVGVDEVDGQDIGFTAYPNPTADLVNVTLPGLVPSNTRIEVLDATGRVMMAAAVRTSTGQLDTSGLPAGVYHLRMVSGAQVLGVRRLTVL